MRILHFITVSEAGGAQSVVAELANGSVQAGHEAAVASDSGGILWDILDSRIRRFEVPCLQKRVDPRADFRAFLGFRRILREYKPDILHLHSSKAGVLGRLLPGTLRPRIVYTVHGFDTIRKAHRIYLPVERALAGSCGAVVAVSEYDRSGLAECGIRRSVQVIPNGIRDLDGMRPEDPALAAEMRRDRAEGFRIVLSIARLAPPKRFDLFRDLARAFEGEPVRFYWIGGGRPDAAGGLPSNLRMPGEIRNAGSYIGECDVFVLLSDFEGLPVSILEALSWGKPILASRVGGIPEELEGGAGILADNDPAILERELRGLLQRPDSGRMLGIVARSRFLERYRRESMVGSYLDLYESLRTSAKKD